MVPKVVFTTRHFLCNLFIGQNARALVTGRPFQPNIMYYSSLLSPDISYKEKVLWIWSQKLYSQHFIFFVTYKLAQ
jgi:hypothetical protein